MSWTVATVILALLVPAITRGSYARLLDTPWRWNTLLGLGLGVQALLSIVDLPEARWHDVGFGALVASYVMLVAWCGGNAVVRGMTVVLVGVSLNALAITANQGMPVDVPASWARELTVEPSVKHHPQTDDDRLLLLTDIVPVPGPWRTMASFGDLILTVGLCDVAFHASRRGRRRTRRTWSDTTSEGPDAGTRPDPPVEGADRDDAGPPTVRDEPASVAGGHAYDPLAALAAYSGLAARHDPLQGLDDAGVVEVPRR
jgi:hypothetical protein